MAGRPGGPDHDRDADLARADAREPGRPDRGAHRRRPGADAGGDLRRAPGPPRGLQGQATPGTGLQQAIEQDHDGSILDDIPGYLQGTANLSPRTTNGEGIVNHVFGGQQQEVARALSSKSGLDMGTIMQLLPILAPIVMGMLGKQARSGGSDPSSGGLGDLGSILGGLGGLGGGGSTTGSPQGGLGEILGGILGGRQSR